MHISLLWESELSLSLLRRHLCLKLCRYMYFIPLLSDSGPKVVNMIINWVATHRSATHLCNRYMIPLPCAFCFIWWLMNTACNPEASVMLQKTASGPLCSDSWLLCPLPHISSPAQENHPTSFQGTWALVSGEKYAKADALGMASGRMTTTKVNRKLSLGGVLECYNGPVLLSFTTAYYM